MKKFIQPDRRTEAGPWLLDEEKLENLSNVLNKVLELLEKSDNLEVEEQLKNNGEKEHAHDMLNKTDVLVCFKSGKLIKYNSLEKVMKDPDLKDQSIRDIKIDYRRGNNSLSFEIIKDGYSSGLEYRISITNEEIKDDVIHILNKWISKSKAFKLIQLWGKLDLVMIVLGSVMALTFYFATFKTKQELYSKMLERNAVELIKNGIDKNTQNEAIRIILEYSIKYVPSDFQTEILVNSNYFVISVFIIGIILGFQPKTNFAIGQGKIKVKFWQLWMKLLFVSIPTTIVLPIILNRF